MGLFAAFFVGLPVILLAALVLIGLGISRAAPALRRSALWLTGGGLAFFILDALLLFSFPHLGISYGPVGFSLAVLFYARALIFIVFVGLLLRQKTRPGRALGIVFWSVSVGLTLLLVYAFAIEPFSVRVTHLTVNVPAGTVDRPLRILHLSDLHVERTTRREAALPALVAREMPDMILLTGDYLNLSYLNDPLAQEDARWLLAQLKAPYGVFAVNGTVDGPQQMHNLFSGTSIIVLDDEVYQAPVPGGSLTLLGVSNWNYRRDALALARLAPSAADYTILLYHTPDLAPEASQAGIDLYLAGHTHGGQIRLPLYGALVTFSVHGKQYEAGRYQVGPTILYVSRGLGMEGSFAPRVRFLTPPEVLVIDLVPGQ